MLRSILFCVLVGLVAFESSYCTSVGTNSVHGDAGDVHFPPVPQSTTDGDKTTVPSTTNHPTSPSTSSTTTVTPAPTTNATTKPSTTTTTATTTVTPSTSSTTTPSPSTTTAAPTTSSSTHQPEPTTTQGPHPPPPSDRKFDPMSFLGGFALGLGLVAIAILSWKFYLSRQENYYHTL